MESEVVTVTDPAPLLGSESGFALIGALLVMVLVTALGSAAIFQSQLDLMLAGNYRVQRAAEASADGALDLVKAMIFGNASEISLPLSIPATDAAAKAWVRTAAYSDPDLDVAFTIKYKQEDTINFNAGENYPDEVVRYGRDYNYQGAQKDIGKQPVYTVSVKDAVTGAKAEADLISTIGFRTTAAIYVKGKIRMTKNPYANEEMIEITSGAGTPAMVTTRSKSGENVFIQRAVSLPDVTGTTRSYREQSDVVGGTDTYSYYPDYRAESSLCPNLTAGGAILTHPSPPVPPATSFCPLTTLNLATGIYALPNQCWPDLYPRVYSDAEIAAEIAAGRYNSARDKMHILLGVGERGDRLDPSNPAKPGYLDDAASYAASKAIFNFDVDDQAVVKYDYRNPDASIPTLEELLGSTFADLRSLADLVLTGDQTVKDFNCNSISGGRDLSLETPGILGTPTEPKLVFFNSNMNDDGTSNGHAELSLVTTGGAVHGYGILVINGDAVIYGSIDWTGLMVVRGKLVFKPWQGGTGNFRSGADLSTRWNGFIMIGGDPDDPSSLDNNYGLHLWTYYGGSLFLGFNSSEVAAIKGVISSTVPHKVLSWRRAYD